jgi:hypothetical protein
LTVQSFILILILLAPNHPLNKDERLLGRVAAQCEVAGLKYAIPPTLIAYWGKRESSLRLGRVGKLGEAGVCQAHGKALRECQRTGYDVTTYEGGLFCIAHLLDMGRSECGSLEAGGVWYATGSCTGTEKARKKIRQRFAAWKRKTKQ